jgi:hypothetical protein
VDVADSPQGDPAAIARWQGACCTEVQSFHVQDATILGGQVYLELMSEENPIDPRHVGIDSVGVGAATVNELKRRGVKVRYLSGGTRAVPGLDETTLWSEAKEDLEGRVRPAGPTVVEAERFLNLRSQVWWRMREDLRLGRVALPDDEGLFQDLCTPTYMTRNGKIVVEPKEEIVKRLRRSPNKGDACCYGNWVRPRRPPRSQALTEVEPHDRNRDMRLEQIINERIRREAQEKKQFQRMFRRFKKRRII